MKKLILILLVSIISLSACTNKKTTNENSLNKEESIQIYSIQKTNWEIDQLITSITDTEDINTINYAITSATKLEGIANVTSPSYLISYSKDGNEIKSTFLWTSTSETGQGMVMDKADTNIAYQISNEAMKNILDMIRPAK